MKIYDCSATIYAEKLKSPEFGITIHTKIEAKNNNEAIELANNSFQKYCDALKKHHNNKFLFTNVKIN